MAPRPSLWVALWAALALSCAMGGLNPYQPACSTDSECGPGQVCFPDGCGDPGENIVVEVTPNAVGGSLAQDFALQRLGSVQDFEALEPAVIQGVAQLELPDGTQAYAFGEEVSFRAVGESLIIPGRTRVLSYKLVPDRGAFQFPVPSGRFLLSATPTADTLYPPFVLPGIEVAPGQAVNIEVSWPTVEGLVRIDGRLVQTASPLIPVQSAAMEVQAVDPQSGRALSQKVPVSSGHAGATGDFFFYLRPPGGAQSVEIRAAPKDSRSLVPSKSFQVPLQSKLQEPLELGDFGTPLSVKGRVLGSLGEPLARALVYLEGEAGGGGTFRTDLVETDEEGRFILKTLPGEDRLELWVVPKPQNPSGILRTQIQVTQSGGDIGDFTAPAKVRVQGFLTRPEGEVAVGVAVTAVPLYPAGKAPLPQGSSEGTTDATGHFTLQLDPAVYRLDFVPSDSFPRVSRLLIVEPIVGQEEVTLPAFTLSRGRRVTGTISSIPRRLPYQEAQPAPYAAVKFFRVLNVEGRPSSMLLAEGSADAVGNYQVILPTR